MQTEKIIDHIVEWLSEYVKNSHQKGFILGISGGLDSAVVSALCAKTNFPLMVLEMPIHQEPSQVSRARKHIEWLKKNYADVNDVTVDLTGVYNEFNQVVDKSETEYFNQLALANTRARLRMTTLYYYATLHGYLVAGTGNKIEDFGIGFFTKYGDGGVDLSPIGDLMKSEVYEIAKHLDIIEEIQTARPTDGLFADNRSDEDQIGATYDELEWAMNKFDEGKKVEEFSDREKDVFEIYEKRHLANLHKINPIPVCEIPKELKG